MNRNRRVLKAVVLAVVAVTLVAAIVIGVIVYNSGTSKRESIVLPSQSADTSVQQTEPSESASTFLEINRENVQTVLQTLQRPDCYYQQLTVERAYDGGSTTETVQIWRRNELYQIELSQDGQTAKYYLTDGETLYLWYEDEDTAAQATLPEGWTVDDLAGIPTYEVIETLSEEEILEASSVELSGSGSSACVYVQYQRSGEDAQEYHWIDTGSGMLIQAQTVLDGDLTYRMLQTELQILTATDSAFEDCFCLPDGTVPFSLD